jgi:hypothetical protein
VQKNLYVEIKEGESAGLLSNLRFATHQKSLIFDMNPLLLIFQDMKGRPAGLLSNLRFATHQKSAIFDMNPLLLIFQDMKGRPAGFEPAPKDPQSFMLTELHYGRHIRIYSYFI